MAMPNAPTIFDLLLPMELPQYLRRTGSKGMVFWTTFTVVKSGT
jgi:hypothetical protein